MRSSNTGRVWPDRRSMTRNALFAPASRARRRSGATSPSVSPGITGAIAIVVSMPASERIFIVSKRWDGRLAPGSTARPIASFGEGDADRDRHGRLARHRREQVDVAADQRALRDDSDRVPVLAADLEAAAREPVVRLERLVAVGVARESDDLALPGAALELFAQALRDVRLHDDLAVEVGARAEAEVLVARARVAVGARMKTSAVRVEAPAEADVGAVVLRERALRLLLVDFELGGRGLAEPLDLGRRPGIRGVGDASDHVPHATSYACFTPASL